MPFAATLEIENSDGQLFSVRIDDVDRRNDRLVLAFMKDGAVGELAFALVYNKLGQNVLQLDKKNSNGYAVHDLNKVIRLAEPFGNVENRDVYLATEEFSDVVLTLELPPSIGMPLIDNIFVTLDVKCELKLDDGETVTVESRTID